MSRYETSRKYDCGYRSLSTYSRNLYDNVTVPDGASPQSALVVAPQFGGIPYSNCGERKGDIKCDTFRVGQPCDGRALSYQAYTQCENGGCAFYSDKGSNTQARY
jgi:hypothetical protein